MDQLREACAGDSRFRERANELVAPVGAVGVAEVCFRVPQEVRTSIDKSLCFLFERNRGNLLSVSVAFGFSPDRGFTWLDESRCRVISESAKRLFEIGGLQEFCVREDLEWLSAEWLRATACEPSTDSFLPWLELQLDRQVAMHRVFFQLPSELRQFFAYRAGRGRLRAISSHYLSRLSKRSQPQKTRSELEKVSRLLFGTPLRVEGSASGSEREPELLFGSYESFYCEKVLGTERKCVRDAAPRFEKWVRLMLPLSSSPEDLERINIWEEFDGQPRCLVFGSRSDAIRVFGSRFYPSESRSIALETIDERPWPSASGNTGESFSGVFGDRFDGLRLIDADLDVPNLQAPGRGDSSLDEQSADYEDAKQRAVRRYFEAASDLMNPSDQNFDDLYIATENALRAFSSALEAESLEVRTATLVTVLEILFAVPSDSQGFAKLPSRYSAMLDLLTGGDSRATRKVDFSARSGRISALIKMRNDWVHEGKPFIETAKIEIVRLQRGLAAILASMPIVRHERLLEGLAAPCVSKQHLIVLLDATVAKLKLL